MPGTSPPVLRRAPGFRRPAARPAQRHDVVRAYLRLLGPATPKHVADYLDAPVAEVKARWPADAVEVTVDGQRRWVLAADRDRLAEPPRVTRLLGPFDLFLQAKDRPLLVADPVRAKALWPVLGRPGGVLVDGELVGMWRPRSAGTAFTVRLELWRELPRRVREAIGEQAEQLAAFRGARLSDRA